MSKWEYLKEEPFLTRYSIAARWLKDYPTIIEIGGYQNCIADFLPERRTTRVIACDPLLDWQNHTDTLTVCFKNKIESLNFTNLNGDYALLMLGFHIEGESLIAVTELAKNASRVVIEYPPRHTPSKIQAEELIANAGLKLEIQVLLDLSGNNISIPDNSYPPFWKRYMLLLKHL